MENFFRYGWLTSMEPWTIWFELKLESWIGVAITSSMLDTSCLLDAVISSIVRCLTLAALVVNIVVAVIIEKIALWNRLHSKVIICLHLLNLGMVLFSPTRLINQYEP